MEMERPRSSLAARWRLRGGGWGTKQYQTLLARSTQTVPVVVFKDVGNVQVVDELERLSEVHEHRLALVLPHGLKPGRVFTGSVHERVDTLTEDLTEL